MCTYTYIYIYIERERYVIYYSIILYYYVEHRGREAPQGDGGEDEANSQIHGAGPAIHGIRMMLFNIISYCYVPL